MGALIIRDTAYISMLKLFKGEDEAHMPPSANMRGPLLYVPIYL